MSLEIKCERRDGICNLCGSTDQEDTCMLLDMAAEVAEWANTKPICATGPGTSEDPDECESCQ